MSTSYENILDRLRDIQGKEASAKVHPDTEALNMKDPAEKGTVTPPDHPEGDSAAATQTPAKPDNPDVNDSRVPGEDLNPSGIEDPKTLPVSKEEPVKGENDVAENTTKSGGEDEVTSKVAGIMDRLAEIRGTKEAAESKPDADGDGVPDYADKAPGEDDHADKKKMKKGKTKCAGEDEGLNMEFTPEFHMKLASELLATEEGVALAQQVLAKAAGEEAAAELIQAAGEQQYIAALQEQELQKQAAEAQAEAEALEGALEEVLKEASEDEIAKIQRSIQVHDKIASELTYDFEQAAYTEGVKTAAAMEDMMAGGEALPEEAPAPSTDEILMLLDAAVQSGEVSEEDAIAIAEMLMAEEGGAAGGADMSEEDMAAMEAATKAAAAIDAEPKAASEADAEPEATPEADAE